MSKKRKKKLPLPLLIILLILAVVFSTPANEETGSDPLPSETSSAILEQDPTDIPDESDLPDPDGSYTNKDGVKVYTTDIIAEDLEFAESKNSAGSDGGYAGAVSRPAPASAGDGFMNIPDGIDEELPFS